MSIIKVPKEVAVSPETGEHLWFYTNGRRFVDSQSNSWTIYDLAASRPGNAVKKWVAENYPETL